jgi:hypothetical protein
MRNQNRVLPILVLLALVACHKRTPIASGEDPVGSAALPGVTDGRTKTPAAPVASADWKERSPASLVGNWASSLFQDQRCTAFYTFTGDARAELNLICLNAEKKQFEREYRSYAVAQFRDTQQVRLKPLESTCPPDDVRDIKPEGAAFLYAVETKPVLDQPLKMAMWEPDVNKTPLSLSKADGLMVEGFPGRMGTYLGMPIINGCFTDGLVSKFAANTTP